jgi:hypothetical protein
MTMQPHYTARVMTILLTVWALTFPTGLAAQETDPFVGLWVLNVAKSKFAPPAAPYKNSTLTIESIPGGQKIGVENTVASGSRIGYTVEASFDGKDYPLPGIGTVALKRIDARTVERIHKADGKTLMTFLNRLSPDGKTLTATQTGTAKDGRAVKSELVYEKK